MQYEIPEDLSSSSSGGSSSSSGRSSSSSGRSSSSSGRSSSSSGRSSSSAGNNSSSSNGGGCPVTVALQMHVDNNFVQLAFPPTSHGSVFLLMSDGSRVNLFEI